jgi:hypothetical protein
VKPDRKLKARADMADWQTLSSEIVYETPWIKVRRDEVRNHLGKPLTYSFIELQHPSVFIIAVNDRGEVFWQKNYRYTIKQIIWELRATSGPPKNAPKKNLNKS